MANVATARTEVGATRRTAEATIAAKDALVEELKAQEAVLGVYLVQRPGGAFHQVRVERPGDQDAVPGMMWCTEVRFRDQARRVWLARARELRSLGYERV